MKEIYKRRRLQKSSQCACLIGMKTPSALVSVVPTQTEITGTVNPVLTTRKEAPKDVSDYPQSTFTNAACQRDLRGYDSDQQYFDSIEIRVDPPSSPSLSNSDGSSGVTGNSSLSLDNISVNSSSCVNKKKTQNAPLVHSYSTADIASDYHSTNKDSREMTISLSLLYNAKEESLYLTLHSAYSLPIKAHKTDVYASVFLFPGKVEEQTSKPVLCTSEYIRFDEVFRFEGVTTKYLEKCSLRVLILSRNISKSGGGKVRRIGELSILCSNLDLRPFVPVKIEMAADRTRLKRVNFMHACVFAY